jgi:hypothetical protein
MSDPRARAQAWPGKRALTDALGQPAPRDWIAVPGKRALTDTMSRRAGGRALPPSLGLEGLRREQER